MFDWLAESQECLRWRKMIRRFDVRNSLEVRAITASPALIFESCCCSSPQVITRQSTEIDGRTESVVSKQWVCLKKVLITVTHSWNLLPPQQLKGDVQGGFDDFCREPGKNVNNFFFWRVGVGE